MLNMKSTTELARSAGYRPIGVAQRRDELLVLQCMNSALCGLLATNTHREDGFPYDAIQLDEITEQAAALGLEMFDQFKSWRRRQRAIQSLKNNPKAVIKHE